MTVKDFLNGLELNYKTEIILNWVHKDNNTVYSTVTFNGNRVSVFDKDDMYEEFVKAFGYYKVCKWEITGDCVEIKVCREEG
jgi:hypothetical protein